MFSLPSITTRIICHKRFYPQLHSGQAVVSGFLPCSSLVLAFKFLAHMYDRVRVQHRDVRTPVRTAPRSGCIFLQKSRSGAGRISARGKRHGLFVLRSRYPPPKISRICTERISADEYVTERSGFFPCPLRSGYPLAEKVTECHGADIRRYKCRVLLWSRYPAHGFFHGAVNLNPSRKPHQTAAFPHGAP